MANRSPSRSSTSEVTPTGWPQCRSIQSEFAAVGIKISPDNLSATDFDNDVYTGTYQLAYDNEVGGPSPYYELRQLLYSANSAPIGKAASTNWERYSSPSTDKLIDQYAATTSTAVQHSIVDQLEQVMLDRHPRHPHDRGSGLVPVRHRRLLGLGHPEGSLRPAGRSTSNLTTR